MGSAGEIAYEEEVDPAKETALAAEVEAALAEPLEVEIEDAPAAGNQMFEKLKLPTCEGTRRNYLTFLGQDRNHLRALGWLDKDKDKDKDKEPPVKNDSATFQGECRKCKRQGHKAGDCGGGGGGRQLARVHVSLTAKPEKPCPSCGEQHSFTGNEVVIVT